VTVSAHTDLFDRFGPMTVKELPQSLRRTSFVYPFLGVHLFATIAIYTEFQLGTRSGEQGKAAMLIWDPDAVGPFWWVAMTICGLLMPLARFFANVSRDRQGKP